MSRRFSRRTIKSVNRPKYSKENTMVLIETGENHVNGRAQGGQVIVAPSTTQGMRKVKHITVSLSKHADDAYPFFWAIVYVPEGYNANPIGPSNGPLYEPNQFVMACGVIDPGAGPIRIRSPISRNLNSGDAISLVIATNTVRTSYVGVVSYAITLQ